MSGEKPKGALKIFLEIIAIVISFNLLIILLIGVYGAGYYQGVVSGYADAESRYMSFIDPILKNFVGSDDMIESTPAPIISSVTPTIQPNRSLLKNVNWGGPDLWETVNARRQELGVNPLKQKDNLCTIASIRLNQQLEIGKLDGHEGFGNFEERRSDLAWIFGEYSTVAEFLLAGADSSQEAVSLWENTLAHKKLLTGGEYVWGCIYAQNSFAVAIVAF